MLTYLMFWVLVGHLIGDYLLQSKEMALSKSTGTGYGNLMCLLHCLIYSAVVSVVAIIVVRPHSHLVFYPIFGMVFLTHFPIDRWGLADKWLKVIGGRQLDEIFKEAERMADGNLADKRLVADFATRQAFTALVYAVVDNTLHFLLMTGGFAALLYWGAIP